MPLKTFLNLPRPKQDSIVTVALEEFADKGFNGASINAMVRKLGIAKGSVYQYFEDKNSLFFYVFTHSMERVKAYLKTIRDETTNAPLAIRLEKTLAGGVDFIESQPLVYKLYITIINDWSVPFREEFLRELRSNSLDYIRSLLETAKLRGELKPDIDTLRACFLIDSVMDRFLMSRVLPHMSSDTGIFHGTRDAMDRWISDLLHMICHGLSNE